MNSTQMKSEGEQEFRSGYVSIIGRPNVGKSTLLNAVLGEKIAIVSPRPQTTRNKIIGINNLSDAQIIFIDTPGIHKPKHRLGEAMIKTARQALAEVDLILLCRRAKDVSGLAYAIAGLRSRSV